MIIGEIIVDEIIIGFVIYYYTYKKISKIQNNRSGINYIYIIATPIIFEFRFIIYYK